MELQSLNTPAALIDVERSQRRDAGRRARDAHRAVDRRRTNTARTARIFRRRGRLLGRACRVDLLSWSSTLQRSRVAT